MIDSFDVTTFIIIIVSLLISITVHEAVHAYIGYFLGDDTAKHEGRITLNPIRHIDPFFTVLLPAITLIVFSVPLLAAKPVPFNPNRVKYEEFGVALIAVAGPLSNLIMAGIAGVIVSIFQGSLTPLGLDIFFLFMIINIGLFIFNMLPIPPLDGSRLLYAFAPESLQRFMASIENLGIFIVFSLVLVAPQAFEFINNLNRSIFNFLIF